MCDVDGMQVVELEDTSGGDSDNSTEYGAICIIQPTF